MILTIANIKRDTESLAVSVDKDLFELIKIKIVNNELLTDEEMLAYDETANDIMKTLKSKDSVVDTAFLLMQLPFIHRDMFIAFIDKVCDEESPVAAYYGINLNIATNSDYQYDRLMTILVSKGSMELLIEAVKTLPDMPMNDVLKKLDAATAAEKESWNGDIVIEAKKLYKDFCDNLRKKSESRLSRNMDSSISGNEVGDDLNENSGLLNGVISKSKDLMKKKPKILGGN